jgi:acetyltransferase
VLSGAESKALLAAFRIPTAESKPARTADAAVGVAEALGYPVVMKIDSPDITHKTEVGGVRLNLSGADDVRAAFAAMTEGVRQARPQARILGVTLESFVSRANVRELFVGAITDPVFGPAITFGTGGTAVEIHADRAVGLPPLNGFLIDEMIRSTRVSRLLGAFRGMPPANVEAIGNVLLRVSEMVCELPWIRELDINPLIADEHGVIAADARVVVAPRPASKRPYDHMAIHPYPVHLVSQWRARNGAVVTIRPIRPEDAQIEYEFVHELSPQTKYLRFMGAVRDLSPSMLARFTQVDYDREMALIGVVSHDEREGADGAQEAARDGQEGAQEAARDGKDGAQEAAREKQIAVARYVINPDGTSCEFAIVVAESWQGQGLARHLMTKLVELARERGLREMAGLILSTNTRMLDLARSLGFTIGDWPDDPELVRAHLALS